MTVQSDENGNDAARQAHTHGDLRERGGEAATPFFLQYTLDHITQGVFLYAGQSPSFMYVNRHGAESLGYTQADLVGGMTLFDVDPTVSPERWIELLHLLKHERKVRIESTHRRRDGSTFPVEVAASFFEYHGRSFILAIVLDISARRAAEAALRESEATYRTLVTTMAEGVFMSDAQGRVTAMNPAAERMLGRTANDCAEGASAVLRDARGRDGRPIAPGELPHERALRTGAPLHDVVLSVPGSDGARLWLSVNCQPLARADGAGAPGVVTTFHDITSRLRAEREAAAREHSYRTLADNTPDIVVRWDRELRRVFVNPTFANVAGRTAEELVGTPFGTGYVPPTQLADARHIAAKVREVFETGEAVRFPSAFQNAEGSRLTDLRLVPERGPDGEVATVLGVGRDVTETQLALDALRASEQRFRQVTENIDEVFWLLDAESGAVVYVSPAFDRVYGLGATLLGENPRAWLDVVHAADRARVEAALAHATGTSEVAYRIHRGSEVRWIRHRWFPVRDEHGRSARIAAVSEDVSIRRELEAQLRQAQKMEAIGQLAGGIAHDFNNILAIVQLQASALADGAARDPAVRAGLNEIALAAGRASNLTQQLLTFSRQRPLKPVVQDLGDSVLRMSNMLRRLVGENITFDVQVDEPLPLVVVDPSMMEQVLLNLVINARDAMGQGGRLTVSLSPATITGEAHVCLSVSDTGTGIEPELLPRIFEPFFTTKDVGKGSGLGLATVFGIVEQHGGRIEVDSELGRGSTFRVLMPAQPGRPSNLPPPDVQAERAGSGELIVLVEDDRALRSITSHVLAEHGYRVMEAGSAVEALEMLEREAAGVDLLLTDVVMPGGVSGRELAAQLTSRRPGLRVLFTSGYAPDVLGSDVASLAASAFLSKPYTAAELVAAVHARLSTAVSRV